MSQAEFQAVTQVVLGCEFLTRPICFLVLWHVFFRPDWDRKDRAAAGTLLLFHLVWWFTEPTLPLRVLLALLIFGYCYFRYGRYCERAAFLILLYQYIWVLSLLLSTCVLECLDSALVRQVEDPERFYPGLEKVIYDIFARNRILSGAAFVLFLVFLTVLAVRIVRQPFQPGWYDVVFLSLFNVVGYLFIRMTIEITSVRIDREVFSLFTQRRDWLWKAPALGMLLYAGELSAIYVWQKLKVLQEERQQHFIKEQQVEAIQKRLGEAEAFCEQLGKVRHEMRNHMANMKSLAEEQKYGEMEDYMARFGETLNQLGSRCQTGHAVTDVIINDRYQRAKKAGISFETSFYWKETDRIPVFDMGILLSNLLDNALEAGEKLKAGEGYIRLSLKRKEPFLLLEVENRFDGRVRYARDGRHLLSLKENSSGNGAEHGLGLRNVQETAERYLGGVDIRIEDQVFRVTVLLQQGILPEGPVYDMMEKKE